MSRLGARAQCKRKMLVVLLPFLLAAAACIRPEIAAAQAVASSVAAVGGEFRLANCPSSDVCSGYVDAHFPVQADLINWIREGVDGQKEGAKQVGRKFFVRDQIIQWFLISLGFFMTIATVITKSYPEAKLSLTRVSIDFAMIPIVLAALVTAVTAIGSYYQFNEYRRINQSVASDLADLQTDIEYILLTEASTRKIDEKVTKGWMERLKTILQQYSERQSGKPPPEN